MRQGKRLSAVFLLAAACSRFVGNFENGKRPSTLAYATNPAVYFKGVAIPQNVPSVAGAATTFNVTPDLPNGLVLNTTTGVISGTANVQVPAQVYQVVAANSAGSTFVALTITVQEAPPALTYLGDPYTFSQFEASSSGLPFNGGGIITGCNVKPATAILPTGLTVDGSTCAITGFPTQVSASQPYTIEATYSAGTADFTVHVAVAGPLSVGPATVTLPASTGSQVQFFTAGGVAPIAYRVVTGPGSIDGKGLFTNDAHAGASEVQAIDAHGHTANALVSNLRVLANGQIYAYANAGNDLYIGGAFDAVNAFPAPSALAIDGDSGAPVTAFDLGDSFRGGNLNDLVGPQAVAATDDAIYYGGAFENYRGSPTVFIVKVDPATGEPDLSFAQNVICDSSVQAMAIDGDSLYLAGQFSECGAHYSPNVIKIDRQTGTPDPFFVSPGFAGETDALIVGDGWLYLGGEFPGGVAKLRADTGAIDPSFKGSVDGSVYALALDAQGLYIGGGFGNYTDADGSVAVSALVRASAGDGTLDVNFTAAGMFDAADAVLSLAVAPDGLWVTGPITKYRTVSVANLVELALDDGRALDFAAPAFDRPPSVVLVTTDGVYVGGSFSLAGSANAQRIAKLNRGDGSLDKTFTNNRGLGGSDASSQIYAMAEHNGVIYVTGDFRTYRGDPVHNLARVALDTGKSDPNFAAPDGVDDVVLALLVSGANLYVGGAFTHFQKNAVSGLVKVATADGTLDTTWSTNAAIGGSVVFADAPEVQALAANDTDLFIGGDFTTCGAVVGAGRICKADLATGLDNTPGAAGFFGSGFNKPVLALYRDGDVLYAGGQFYSYQGGVSTAQHLIGLNLTTGAANAFVANGDGPSGMVTAITAGNALHTGSILVGGKFANYTSGGAADAAGNFAEVDPTSGIFYSGNVGFNDMINTMVSSPAKRTFVAGPFSAFVEASGPVAADKLMELESTIPDALFSPANMPLSTAPALNTLYAAPGMLFIGGGDDGTYRGTRLYGGMGVNYLTGDPIF